MSPDPTIIILPVDSGSHGFAGECCALLGSATIDFEMLDNDHDQVLDVRASPLNDINISFCRTLDVQSSWDLFHKSTVDFKGRAHRACICSTATFARMQVFRM